MPSSKIE